MKHLGKMITVLVVANNHMIILIISYRKKKGIQNKGLLQVQ